MPPKKLKKPPGNSFSVFLEHYQKNEAKRGNIISKHLAAEQCTPIWKNMTKEEKKPYEEEAGFRKQKDKTNLHNKFTTDGRSYAEVEAENASKEAAKKKMFRELDTIAVQLFPGSTLEKQVYHLVHVNYFCITDSGAIVPAEIAISSFSLSQGLISYYHTLIDPGRIPPGYAHTCRQLSEDTHKLPLPPNSLGETDRVMIFCHVKEILNAGRNKKSNELPPLFCLENNMKPCYLLLSMLEAEYNEDAQVVATESILKIYPLHELYFILRQKCAAFANTPCFPTAVGANGDLEKDYFQLTYGIACEFHQAEERDQHCSLSFVQRYVYHICDVCCDQLQIPFSPGKHCPVKKTSESHVASYSNNAPFTFNMVSETQDSACAYLPSSVHMVSETQDNACAYPPSSVPPKDRDFDDDMSTLSALEGWRPVTSKKSDRKRF